MTMDYGKLWLHYQIAAGETALALRQSGATWRQIADQLRLADETHARRCTALYLSADVASRQAAQDGRGNAQAAPATDALPDAQHTTGAKG